MKPTTLKKVPGKTASIKPWGDLMSFFNDYHKFRQKKIAKYGKIHKVRYLQKKVIMLLDKEAVNFVLIRNGKKFNSKEAWEKYIKDLFPNGLMLMDGERHRYDRSIMNEAFKKEPMEGYFDMMKKIVPASLDLWNDPKPKLAVNLKSLTLEIAMEVFFGLSKDQQFKKISKAITDLLIAGSAKPINLPFTDFSKGIKARKFLANFFRDLIPERKNNPGNDLFSILATATNDEGEFLDDQQIIDHLIFNLAASHDTTASTLTSFCYFLAKHPEWQDTLRAEAIQFYKAHGTDIKPTDFRKLEKLNLALKETLRRFPPLATAGRVATETMEYKGYEIPEGAHVSVDFVQNHHDPEIWSCPMKFDPERFSKERSEHTTCPHTYTPFSAGAHYCVGFSFAEMQVRYIISTLLLTHKWSVPTDYKIPMKLMPLHFPTDGLPVSMEKITCPFTKGLINPKGELSVV